MYIGKLSKETGVSPKAIRHYEEIGLLRNIQRQGSYRIYEAHHIKIIKLIQTAQALGFKLKDMKPLIDEKYQTQRFPLEFAVQAMETKRCELRDEIAKAQATLKAIDQLQESLIEIFPPEP